MLTQAQHGPEKYPPPLCPPYGNTRTRRFCVVLCCVVLCCVVLCCVVLCCVVLCCVVLCCVVLCCVALRCVVLCCVVLCCVVLCCVVLRIGLLQFPVCVMPLGSCLRFENLLQSITNNGVKRYCHTHVWHGAYSSQFALCRVMPQKENNTTQHTTRTTYLLDVLTRPQHRR